MNLRNRLTLGIGVLFVLILLLGFQSVRSVRQLSVASKDILADNYNSVHYVEEMLRSLDRLSQDSSSRDVLINSLTLQQQNITEVNEKEVTSALTRKIDALTDSVSIAQIQAIRDDLYRIMELNMNSIRAKSSDMESRAEGAVQWLTILSALCILLAVIFLFRFPAVILRPIDKLKQGITQIANHNYDERLDFGNNKEFSAVAASFNDMACKLSEYRRSSLDRLMTEKKRIEAIVNSLHEPIIGLDSERNILFMNDEAFSILNLKRGNIIGRKAAEIALHNDLLRRLIREVYAEHDDHEHEPLKIYADNKESYFQMDNFPLYINPVGETRQQFVGNLIILNNVTKYKELDSAKTNFIATVSHEMKTPISSILMSLQLLGDSRLGSLNEEQTQLLGSIRESSDRLLNITGELLNLTQVESGKLTIKPKIVKPIELIEYAIKATQVLAERFLCFVEVEYPEKISKLFVDNEKIAWVITNLLSNAIHHSPENSRIIIGASQHDRHVDIYVQDFGHGIDPRYHKSIFERYFRVPGTKVQGSGLGLAISKEFVEAHGGTISIESGIGKGCRFTVSIPV
ncbi:ATP-binding protein [Alistipes sp.]|uniref:sensor histidine kinase n=1 Tax=Alistipes sp. TaxID=1872444 RepID=UPI0025BB1FEA|nr:ATP-binding protein [Alistipes sp.]MCI7139733.1 ATP-binding protein [Alistipes sp.]MDY5396691.1 ATP-binding protein [Alistipes sp.]